MKHKLEKISPIEECILRMLVGEMTDNEIAFALDISAEILEKHFSNIFIKINVSDKNSAKEIAINNGFVLVDM